MRTFQSKWCRIGAVVLTALSLTGSGMADGVLRYATVGEPPSLDQHVVSSDLSTTIAQHVFEGLYTFNSRYEPEPLLAERAEISDGGKTILIHLRRGVKFHNGKEMTSADVAASLERWRKHGVRGPQTGIESATPKGDYAVEVRFGEVFGPWQNFLAFTGGGAVIYPEEIASKAGEKPLSPEDYIGTGPYQFGEWRPNRYLELTRFDGYAGRSEAADGYAGRREAKLDKLRFVPSPDAGARVAGLRAGDFDYAENIPGDLFDELDSDSGVRTILSGAPLFGLVFMNSKHGPLAKNFALRRAIQAALNKEEALRVSIGPEKLWGANGSFFAGQWQTDSGADAFSMGAADKAKQMAAEASYDGAPIKFMVSTNYPFHYDQAVVFTKQLAAAGFNIDLQVYDWATLIQKRAQPKEWDLFFTHHGFVPDPSLLSVLNDNYPGWWTTAKKAELKAAFTGTTDAAKRRQVWGDLQALIYEEVPTMKTGDVYSYNIASPQLRGVSESTLIWPHFWGADKQ